MATLPILSLNDLAQHYRAFLVPIKANTSTELAGIAHQPGTYSLYVAAFTLYANETYTFYHCGQTSRDPRNRLTEHKSEFLNCKVTTFNAKSVMYDPFYMKGLTRAKVAVEVLRTGMTAAEAKKAEADLSSLYRDRYGPIFAMTNPSTKPS